VRTQGWYDSPRKRGTVHYFASQKWDSPRFARIASAHNNSQLFLAITSVGQPATDEAGRLLHAGERLRVGASINTGAGGRITFVTPKGSELHLDANSKVTFTSNTVAMLSRGRLYCTNRDKEIARIDTPAGHVRLLGTVVDAAVVGKDQVAVTVVEGKVQLSNGHGSALVGAGNRSILLADSAPGTGTPVDTLKETAWYHGRNDVQSDFGDIAYAFPRADGLLTEIWNVKADGTNAHRVGSFMGWSYDLGPWLPGERWLSMEWGSILWTTPDVKARSANAGAGHPIVDDRTVLLDAATGESVPVELPKGYQALYTSFAPDPTRLAFCGSYRADTNSGDHVAGGVYVYDRSSGKITQVYNGWIKTPVAWSPDGRHMAMSSGEGYTNDHKLLIIDTQTGEKQELGVTGAGPSYSPDGARIAYSGDFKHGGGWYNGIPMSGSIFTLDLAPGSKPVRVSPSEEDAVKPRWSPDGSRVVYVANTSRVCAAHADGTEHRVVYDSNGGTITKTSWSPDGNALFVVAEDSKRVTRTMLVGGDGSGVMKILGEPGKDTKLPADALRQTEKAVSAIKEAVFRFAMGKVDSLEADLNARRKNFAAAADSFSHLPWKFPLSGIGTDDALRYADVAAKEAAKPDAVVLHESCRERMQYMGFALTMATESHHRFPPDLKTALEWAGGSGWQIDWLSSTDRAHVMMLGTCPGAPGHSAEPFAYTMPADGQEPKIGDVVISCPLYPDISFKWSESDSRRLNRPVAYLDPGQCRVVEPGLPYYFENVGDAPLKVIHHSLSDTYEAQGKVKVLPLGKVYSNERFTVGPLDEIGAARAIDALATPDWGSLPKDEKAYAQARENLTFCRCVARYQAGLPVTECKTIDGEPARLMYSGTPGGSCGAYRSNLRFELLGSDMKELYQLMPSGRFRVHGTVRVIQTNQICKNGWIDKNGKVTSTEK
jgi:WD40 repeat protein